MNKKVIEMLITNKISYKEYAIYTMLSERKFTITELADFLKSDRSNTFKNIKSLVNKNLLDNNYYTKQYWARK